MHIYGTKNLERKKKLGEIFTPPGIVFKMVMIPEVHEDLKNLEKPFFDPGVGEGQFPCAELVLKMFYNLDKLNEEKAIRILKSICGMDIQAENVDKCRAHILATFCDAYQFFIGEEISETTLCKAIIIIAQNFKTGDSLKFMSDVSQLKIIGE